jgi:5-methyltetrahydrofolate--homocysteine methyltransferase
MSEIIQNIKDMVIQGKPTQEDEGYDDGLIGKPGVVELTKSALEDAVPPKDILDAFSAAMEEVGRKYDEQEYFIPDMLASAEAVGSAMEILEPYLLKAGTEMKEVFVIATVKGDLHDIGKNIVSLMLKGAGFRVRDLGNDVGADIICDTVQKEDASFIGLSALLTSTMQEMSVIIQELESRGIRKNVKVLVGGAPLSAEFAEKIGADAYCEDAFEALKTTEELR